MSAIVFRRGIDGPEFAPWENLKPSQWCPAPEFYGAAGWAFTCCPNGHFGTIGQTHYLQEGTELLEPSYVCPIMGCTFHEFVYLDSSRTAKAAPPSVGTP